MRFGDGMKWVAFAVAMGAAVPAFSQPIQRYNGIRDTPIVHFSQADIDLMTKTIDSAMSTGEDGVTVKWENPGTPNSGSVTPGKDPKGRPGCRLAQIENRHGTLQNSGAYILCKNKTKTSSTRPWQVLGPWMGS